MDLSDDAARINTCVKSACLFLGICFSSAAILIAAPKSGPGSFVRYAWLAVIVACTRLLFQQLLGIPTSLVINGVIIGQLCLVILQICNFLAVTRFDSQDLVRGGVFQSSDGVIYKLYRSVGLMFNLRGVGTPWQIRRLHPFPSYLEKHGEKTRLKLGPWITRQFLVMFWQYLFLDFAYFSSLQTPPEEAEVLFGVGTEFLYFGATAEQWIARVMVSLTAGTAPSRVTIDLASRLLSVVSVLAGLSSPEDWPPLFGSIWDAYTTRRSWSVFWHQYCRWWLTSVSNYICRDLLHLRRPSRLERYLNTAVVFMGSGVFHVMIDTYCWQPPTKGPTIAFFVSFAVAVFVEDAVQEIYRRISGKQYSKDNVPVWHKLVGFAWVAGWLSMTAPWYLYHAVRQPAAVRWLVPVSIIDAIGTAPAAGMLVGVGLIVRFVFGGEV